MEQAAQEFTISPIGALLAALSSFIIGGLWYSPLLFGKKWMSLNGLVEEELKKGTSRVFLTSFALQVLAAFVMAAFLGKSGLVFSMGAGFMIGLGWVGAAMGTTYLFERKSFQLYLINAGYHIIAFTVMGAIIGGFQA